MSDTTNTTENMEQVTEQEKEMQEAQASGVVNFVYFFPSISLGFLNVCV